MSSSSVILQNNENITFVSNPSITYFKSVYRKHTKFSIGYYETGTALNFFDETTSKIIIPFDVTADLLCDISLKVKFITAEKKKFKPPDDIALHLIKNITFNLQGKLNDFDKLDKEYINFNAMLNNPQSSNSTYTLDATGKLTCNNGNNFQNMALCGGITGSENLVDIKSMDAIIPLPFAFSKSIGTAIPLCAFNQTTTTPQIVIKGNETPMLDESLVDITKFFKFSAIAKYIFLSDEERIRFVNARLEYLFERVNTFSVSSKIINISTLNKKHPIKQIFIDIDSTPIEYNISINGVSMFSSKFSHEFFSKVEILNKFKGCIYDKVPLSNKYRMGLIDFSLKNTEGPSGCISPSNNIIYLTVYTNDNDNDNTPINIHTVCYYILRISDGELIYVFD